MNNLLSSYIKENQFKFHVTEIELNKLKTDGYVKLSRNKEFWNKHKIDINEFVKHAENLIKKENKFEINNIDKNIFKPEKGANRVSNLIGKNLDFKKFIAIPDILFLVDKVLESNFRISSIDIREPLPNHGGQGLHLDWNQRKNIDDKYLQCSAFIYLDNVDESNGPLRLIPKSHIEMFKIKSSSMHKDKRTEKDHEIIEKLDKEKSIKITANKGDIVLLNMCVFHGGTTNLSGKRRRTIFINFRSISVRQQLDQFKYIPKKNHNNFSEIEKKILHLYQPKIYDKIKRFLYDYRKNKLVMILKYFLSFFRK